MNLDTAILFAQQRVHRSVGQRAMHLRVWVSDETRKAVWLAECESAVALGKVRARTVQEDEWQAGA